MTTKKFSLLEVVRETILHHERRYIRLGEFGRQVYRREIETRSLPIAKNLNLTHHELSVLLVLAASEDTLCDLLPRRCASFWQDDLRDVIILENRLNESLRLGALSKYVEAEDLRRIGIKVDCKADVYRALAET